VLSKEEKSRRARIRGLYKKIKAVEYFYQSFLNARQTVYLKDCLQNELESLVLGDRLDENGVLVSFESEEDLHSKVSAWLEESKKKLKKLQKG